MSAEENIMENIEGRQAGDGPVYFWREYDSQWSFLSQWYDSPFQAEDKGITYVTAEQFVE
jgi:hypothetical protein